ncbi:MAG: SAM-dependent methyltransferase [Bacteroidales bacterium]|nr:SAM-dependent methyltransferase [Bacteroidales bacterium]
MKTLQDIFTKLELPKDALIRLSDKEWRTKVNFPSRVYRFLEQTNPDAFFCLDNKPMILFFENPQNKEKLHKDIWNFNETPIVFIIEKGLVEICNGFNLLREEKALEKIGGEDKLNNFRYFELVTGKTWETYKKELTYKNRADYKLLTNIKDARRLIIEKFPESDNEDDKKRYTKITNALLGKIIFVRYLIDRKVILNFEGKSKPWTNSEFCVLLQNIKKTKDFFDYLTDKEIGFNGNLFPITKEEYGIIPNKAYEILVDLLNSKNIGTGQLSLFDLYDFSIIPTEFISNVYESFVGVENQAKEGVYYTPLFLVDYILSETIESYINQIKSYNCKVLDPSCGSGVFLVEVLRKLIEQYKKQNKKIFEKDKEEFKENIKNIAIENIFGIDKDESAVQVAIFSIYLTLLSEMDPPEIATFKFPDLINTNFFCADFFDETAKFNSVLKDKEIDFIVGNPPWMRGKNEKKTTKQEPLYVEYINNRRVREKQSEFEIGIGNKEIAQAFLLRSSDFSTKNTKCALIVTSKVLYNQLSKGFRQYFLHNYLIEQVFELAPVRREVFDKSNGKAITPACVLFFKHANGQNTNKNLVEHIVLKPSRFFSMFKIFTVNRHDVKIVQQDRLKENDWMWKVLVYGSYLDFNFIKRLKDNYKTIESYINDECKFIIKQGIKKVDGENKIDVSELAGWKFIDTDVKSKKLQPYFIVPDLEKWREKEVGYVYRQDGQIVKDIFTPPALLVKDGLTSEFKTVATMLDVKGVFTDNVTSIKALDSNSDKLLTNVLLLLCSELNSYWALQTASFVGIKQERSHDSEKFSFPFIQVTESESLYKKINALKEKLYKLKNTPLSSYNSAKVEQEINNSISEIDRSICQGMDVSHIEQELINYAKNITIPSIKYKFDKITSETDSNYLTEYANLFVERFKDSFASVGKKFVVEVWHTQQIIGMFFKVVPKSEYKQDIIWEDKQNDTNGLFQKIIQLGTEKITDKLFIQKDIRGFEKDCFYVFKPNEKRLWHKAVGYLDVYEFLDAILKTGRDKHE